MYRELSLPGGFAQVEWFLLASSGTVLARELVGSSLTWVAVVL